jgi:hypothetical protein
MSTDFDALSLLWNKAKNNLDEQELKNVAGLDGHAGFLAGNLTGIVEGLGCLVLSDNNAGNFQDADSVSTLLFSISNQIDHIHGLLFISGEASAKLEDMKQHQGESA